MGVVRFPRPIWGGGGRNFAGQVRVNYTGLSLTGFTELVERELAIEGAGAVSLSTEPTTWWPVGSPRAYHPGFFDATNLRLKEAPVPGQVTIWRIQGSYTGKVAGTTRELQCRLFNPDSGFQLFSEAVLSSGLTAGNFSYMFTTIADSASLPVGRGYKLGFTYSTTNANMVVAVSGITRISMAVDTYDY